MPSWFSRRGMIPPPNNGTGYSNHESPSANTWRGWLAGAGARSPCPAFFPRPFTPRFFMMSSVAVYSLMRRRRSCRCLSSSLRRSRPTAAGDAGAVATLAVAASGDRALARARAWARVTGPPVAPDFAARTALRGRAGLGRADLTFGDFLATDDPFDVAGGGALTGSSGCERGRLALAASVQNEIESHAYTRW